MKTVVSTLCLVQNNEQILLGLKKRGFGARRWNGFGGKVEPGEAISAAAVREVQEECGITVHNLRQRGILHFTFDNHPDALEVHVFSTSDWEGTPHETDEMRPAWFTATALPYTQMWADDIHWFPLFLAGKDFTATFHFKDFHTIDHFVLNEVAPLAHSWHTTSVT